MFFESSPCLIGRHDSCSAAQRPVELSEKRLQNLFNKLLAQTVHIMISMPRNKFYHKMYTLRRPVMGEVLSTRIWGVPPAGGPLL